VGFPTLKKLAEAFKENDNVLFLGIQTVFEGHSVNTRDKLRKNQLKWDLKIAMAHAPGNPEKHEIPTIMRNYRSAGTPWTVIIDRSGTVAYNNFHIESKPAVELIEKLLYKEKNN